MNFIRRRCNYKYKYQNAEYACRYYTESDSEYCYYHEGEALSNLEDVSDRVSNKIDSYYIGFR